MKDLEDIHLTQQMSTTMAHSVCLKSVEPT